MAKKTVTTHSTVKATPDHVATDLAGKTAILGLKDRTYYTLDEVGSPIWSLIQNETSVSDVQQALLKKYDVEPHQCEQDLVQFLQTLADLDLIEVK